MNSWVSAGGEKRAFTLEIGTKNQRFLENLTLAAESRSIHLIVAMTVYMPVGHWHYTRARFTVLVSSNDEIAVHSCPLLCLRRGRLRNLGADCSIWSELRNNNTAINLQTFTSSSGSRRSSACDQGPYCGIFSQICFLDDLRVWV